MTSEPADSPEQASTDELPEQEELQIARLIRSTLSLMLIGFFAICLGVVGVAANLLMNMFIAKKGVEYVATYGTLVAIAAFVKVCGSFLFVGTTPLVGRAIGEKDYKQVGSILRVSLCVSILIGITVGSLVLMFRSQLLWLFAGSAQWRVLADLGNDALTLFAVGFYFSQMGLVFLGVFIGLLYLPHAIFTKTVAMSVLVAVSMALFDGYGLKGFGIAYLLSELAYTLVSALLLFGSKRTRSLYGFFDFQKNQRETVLHVSMQMVWTGVRSLCTESRYLISVICATRLGLDIGASYAVLHVKTSFVVLACGQMAIAYNFLCSRMLSSGERAFTLAMLDWFFQVALWMSAVPLFLWLSGGRDALVSNVISDLHGADVIPTSLFCLFIAMQPIRALVSIAEHAVIVFGEARSAGLISVFSFLLYVGLVSFGHSSFVIIYLADFLFFFTRLILVLWRLWIHGWRPCYYSIACFVYRPMRDGMDPLFHSPTDKAMQRSPCVRVLLLTALSLAYSAFVLKKTINDPMTMWIVGGGDKKSSADLSKSDCQDTAGVHLPSREQALQEKSSETASDQEVRKPVDACGSADGDQSSKKKTCNIEL
eukprot:TRINITY_DN32920_c0_g1_i1.p1 TRINITY_DN32920_c0_g1~~TRINITY_DN32920_c0_g1_i1.p1  ORF type:complete len:596 (-),score=62.82 TRINITY_DN32920_c0_g1_i1:607-2394(-)